MVDRRCPYQSDLRWVIWSNPIKMIRFNEKWMNWSEMSEMKWNEWFDGNDLEQPYGNGPMSRLRVSLWKWLDVSDLIKPYQNDQNRWEMNELKWIEWIEVKWVIWWNWLGTTLWKSPYGQNKVSLWKWLEMSDLIKPYQNEWNRWEMSEMKWNEWIEVKWVIWWNWLGTTLWKSPYESVESVPMEVTWVKVKMNVPIKMNGIDEIWMNWSE